MKIAIVEDHLMVREFVKKVCLQEPDLEVVVEAATGKEAVARIVSTSVDIVMLDIELPDFDGIEVLSRIREHGIHPLAIVLSCHLSPYLVFRIEKANIPGFVDKRAQTLNELRCAIRAIRSNRTFFSPSFLEMKTKKRLDPLAFDKLLTDQQILVLSMVADLFDDAVIAHSLNIAERTVAAHRTAIMHKLGGVHSRTELIRVAREQGFTSAFTAKNIGEMHDMKSRTHC